MTMGPGIVEIRPHLERDAAATPATFLAAVTVTASADYSTAQIAAVSPPHSCRKSSAGRVMGGATALSTNASITARPFFERHGFHVMAEQLPVVRGVRMTYHRMVKNLN